MPDNVTNIVPPRVPLIDDRTGLISREWYRFFLNIFTLTGGGTNTTTITDLNIGPLANSTIASIREKKSKEVLTWLSM
jgi:hypothetical protein